MPIKTSLRVLTAAAMASLAACGSDEVGAERLESVHAGMPKDSLMSIMGRGPLTGQFADTLRLDNGFRKENYLVNGKVYQVLYYRDRPGNVAEPVEQYTETPVVLSDGKVLGWGWRFYVEEAMENLKLPTPIKEKLPAGPQPAPEEVRPVDSSSKS